VESFDNLKAQKDKLLESQITKIETQLAEAQAELKQLRQRVEAYNGFEPCDFKRLDSLNKQLEESAKGYKSLVPELLQLRKVRDAAEALPTMDCFITGCFDYHCDCGFKVLGQALSQPKEAE
jgi:chromosome segregation ATPase